MQLEIEIIRYKQSRIYELKMAYQTQLERLDSILSANMQTVKKDKNLNVDQKTQYILSLVTQYYINTTNLENALNKNISYISEMYISLHP
jgi:hypothetical protein